jgi:hypothetical protein
MMALFDNLIAADLKKDNDIMFIMVSSSRFQVATRADGGLEGQLAWATMYYGVFLTIVNITKGGCGCCFGDEKVFNVGINRRLHWVWFFPPQPLTTIFRHDGIMDVDVIIFTLSAPVWHIQGHVLYPYIMVDAAVPWFDPIPPIGRQGTQKQPTKRCGW